MSLYIRTICICQTYFAFFNLIWIIIEIIEIRKTEDIILTELRLLLPYHWDFLILSSYSYVTNGVLTTFFSFLFSSCDSTNSNSISFNF